MSNLSRLQAVSSSLDTAIKKVNNLPDAGGSGGGNVETCTVTLVGEAPIIGSEMVWYVDGTLSLKEASFPDFGDTKQITVIKNSIVYANCSLSIGGDVTRIADENNIVQNAYFVSGNGELINM